MAETLRSDIDFTVGRGGLLIPDHEFGELAHPSTVVDFLDGMWSLNGGTRRNDTVRDRFDIETAPDVNELVIPGAGRRPLAVLRYAHKPPKSTYDTALDRYSLLMAPRKVGEFRYGLIASHQFPPSYGSESDCESLSVEHRLGKIDNLRILAEDETYSVREEAKLRLLGQIMNKVVKFVS